MDDWNTINAITLVEQHCLKVPAEGRDNEKESRGS